MMQEETNKQLTVGDKIRIIESDEGAQIVEVIDEFHAVVDTFDGDLEIHSKQVEPYQSGDVRKPFHGSITFVKKNRTPVKKQDKKDEHSFNNRKNRFKYELDLHAESLIGETDTMSNEEILSIQKSKIKDYLNEAIELRIQRVYLIHGIGSGRLKAEVDTILHNHPQITNYNNNYHPKYGIGATEVILR